MTMKRKVNVVELFHDKRASGDYVKICAPMVRYSKLEFRQLVRRYGVDLCYTPMILADSFSRSEKCRQNEFSTNLEDSPLICQFAASNVQDLLRSTEYVSPYVDGVDINCGCPQNWAMKQGMGSALLKSPEKIEDFVRTLKRNVPDISVSTKLRLQEGDNSSAINVELAKRLEKIGVDFIAIHGRTPSQKSSEAVDWDAIGLLKENLQIPLVANGGITTLAEANTYQKVSNCDGIMVANGILQNPTLFAGTTTTTRECLEYWLTVSKGMRWQLFQHHLSFMTETLIDKRKRMTLNSMKRNEDIFNFIVKECNLDPTLDFKQDYGVNRYTMCTYQGTETNPADQKADQYNSEFTEGKFFKERCQQLIDDSEKDSATNSDLTSIFG